MDNAVLNGLEIRNQCLNQPPKNEKSQNRKLECLPALCGVGRCFPKDWLSAKGVGFVMQFYFQGM